MTIITLTTDFGTGDQEAGVLKGVIWQICSHAQIADLSHEVTPQQVLEGALLLWRATPFFPDGTIHVAVVDPGVGTSRRGIAARIGAQYFVGPDNGIFTLVHQRGLEVGMPIEWIHLNQVQYWLPHVTSIFHGRDIFAPVAAHLANGVPLAAMGTPFNNPQLLPIPQPKRTTEGWQAEIIHVDHFGNLAVYFPKSLLDTTRKITIHTGGHQIHGLVETFGDLQPGELAALFDSSELLAISIINGNAARTLGIQPGDNVEIILS